MDDLCWQCQKASTAIQRSANLSEEEKSEVVRSAQEHLRIVKMERSSYTAFSEDCSRSVRAHFHNNASFSPPPPSSHIPPNSNHIRVHYSFDYAQQVCPNKAFNSLEFYSKNKVTTPFFIRSLSIGPDGARPHFPYSEEVFCLWGTLWDYTSPNQLHFGWVWRDREGGKRSDQWAELLLRCSRSGGNRRISSRGQLYRTKQKQRDGRLPDVESDDRRTH